MQFSDKSSSGVAQMIAQLRGGKFDWEILSVGGKKLCKHHSNLLVESIIPDQKVSEEIPRGGLGLSKSIDRSKFGW